MKLPVIEAAVDNGVVHSGAHCQPHDSQIDLLSEGMFRQVRVELINQEIHVVGEPANGEGAHHDNHHLHHLRVEQRKEMYVCKYTFLSS